MPRPASRWRTSSAEPNIDRHTEFVDALKATRAYEANIGVMEITKSLGEATLQILAWRASDARSTNLA